MMSYNLFLSQKYIINLMQNSLTKQQIKVFKEILMEQSDQNLSLPILNKNPSEKLTTNKKREMPQTINRSQLPISSLSFKYAQTNHQEIEGGEQYTKSEQSNELADEINDHDQLAKDNQEKEICKSSHEKNHYGNQKNVSGVRFHVYHNKALQALMQMNQIQANQKTTIQQISAAQTNRDFSFARVHSLNKKPNNAIASKKNQIKMRMERELNFLWMDALTNMGIYKQDGVFCENSKNPRNQGASFIRIQNIGHNLRYVRKLKPISGGEQKKEQQFSRWKMKILGKGQNINKNMNQGMQGSKKYESKKGTHLSRNQKSMNEPFQLEISSTSPKFEQKKTFSNKSKKKIMYSEDSELEKTGDKICYKQKLALSEKKQEETKTLNHSNSDYHQSSLRITPKKSYNKDRNSFMIESNPEEPIMLIPQSTIIYEKVQEPLSHKAKFNKKLKEKKEESIKVPKQLQKSISEIKRKDRKKFKQIRSITKIKSPTNNSKKKQFKVPFDTYYYRELLWKVNFTNELIIHTPLEYEHRLRMFIGKGNNSGLIRGLMKRRIWFAVTDRLEDANFVWTQLKCLSYFNLQPPNSLDQIESRCKNHHIPQKGILTEEQNEKITKYFEINMSAEERQDEKLQYRNKFFTKAYSKIEKTQIQISQSNKTIEHEEISSPHIRKILSSVNQIRQQRLQNHFINNYVIGNKKTLFKTLSSYYKSRGDYVFNYLPYTFHVGETKDRENDESYERFLRFYEQRQKQIDKYGKDGQLNTQNYWIVKPGENSNRGNGIKFCKSLEEIKEILERKQQFYQDGTFRTYILQTYIDKPLLYQKRKFDIRHYMMITCINGVLKGYWYRDGYIRTTSTQYSLNNNEGKTHLTNDAIQKQLPEYGKYEKGNKISYDQIDSYLNRYYGYKNYRFKDIILPKMKEIGTDIIKACSGTIDPEFRDNNFQLFGLDFMIDAEFNLWLIEVNTNPCLEISCPMLGGIIPKMMQNIFQITVDAMFPPPVRYTPKGVHYLKKLQEENRFDLVYDSRVDGIYRESKDVLDVNLLEEEDETFEDDGSEWSAED